MRYTSLQPEEIRQRVYEEAKKQFLEQGITQTEMKQLALAVGIGRTTLYRYFPSIHPLAFMAATEFWDELFLDLVEPEMDQDKSGYELLCEFYDGLIEKIDAHPREFLFFSEFDALFVPNSFPDFPEAQEYTRHIKRVLARGEAMVEKGKADGSLRSDIDLHQCTSGLTHALMGYEQRTAMHPTEWRRPGKETMHWMARCMLENLKA